MKLAFDSRMANVYNLSNMNEIVNEMIAHIKQQIENTALSNSQIRIRRGPTHGRRFPSIEPYERIELLSATRMVGSQEGNNKSTQRRPRMLQQIENTALSNSQIRI